jgi:hypothetical protein
LTVRHRAALLALVLVSSPMLVALAQAPGDDAGTGQDAPGQPGNAVNLTPGAYVGNLTPGSEEDDLDAYDSYVDDNVSEDQDWYRVNASQPGPIACTSVRLAPDDEPHNETRVHVREPALDQARLNATTNATGTTLAHVGPSPSGTLAGVSHVDPPRVTQYDLELEVTRLGEATDAGSQGKVPGACFGDTLEDEETQGWTFDAEEGDLLYVSFGTEIARSDDLVLTAPNGTEIGAITSEDGIAIGAHTIDAPGEWTLTADAGDTGLLTTASSDYVASFNLLEDPDPEEEEEKEPCQPHCMVG